MAKKQRNTLVAVTPASEAGEDPNVVPQIIRRSGSGSSGHVSALMSSPSEGSPQPATRVHSVLPEGTSSGRSHKYHYLFVILSFLCLAWWYFSWREGFHTHVAMSLSGEVPTVILLPELHAIDSVVLETGSVVTQARSQNSEQVAYGVVRTSFAKAAKEAGVSYEIVDEVVDLFSDEIVFDQDFREGDRFTIIYQDEAQKKSGEAGRVLAAAVDVGTKRLVATRFIGTDGKARYFDRSGQAIGNGFLRYPLEFSRVTSYFSYARFHPVLKQYRPHHGVDFAAPVGTPVRAVASGRVTIAGPQGSCGIMVKIEHNERYSTAYLHLSKIPNGLIEGSFVTRGQIIGAVGATGLVTGPHLHYSFFDRGQYVDPLKIQLPTIDALSEGSRISKNYLHRVLFTLEHYQDVDIENVAL